MRFIWGPEAATVPQPLVCRAAIVCATQHRQAGNIEQQSQTHSRITATVLPSFNSWALPLLNVHSPVLPSASPPAQAARIQALMHSLATALAAPPHSSRPHRSARQLARSTKQEGLRSMLCALSLTLHLTHQGLTNSTCRDPTTAAYVLCECTHSHTQSPPSLTCMTYTMELPYRKPSGARPPLMDPRFGEVSGWRCRGRHDVGWWGVRCCAMCVFWGTPIGGAARGSMHIKQQALGTDAGEFYVCV